MYLRGKKNIETNCPRPPAQSSCPSPAATLRPKTCKQNTMFRAPASSPTQAPCNIHAAITMWSAPPSGKPKCIYAHGSTTWKQSYSHSNAICNRGFHKIIELHTFHKVTNSPLLHFSKSPLLQVITSLSHHFPKSTHCTKPSLLWVTTSQSLKVTISLSQPTSQSHTNVFVRNSEDCLPTSFDNHDFPPKVYGSTTCVDLQYCITMHDQPFDPTAEACDKQYAF